MRSLIVRRRRAAKQRPHARHQLVRAERLDDVVVRARVEPEDALGLFAARGQHDDRERRRAVVEPKGLAHLEAVQPRQHQIQDDEIGRGLPGCGERPPAVVHDFGAVTGLVQIVRDERGDVGVVFDDENRAT